MRIVRPAVGGALGLLLAVPGGAEPWARVPRNTLPGDVGGGIRADRLSRSEKRTWKAIVEIVKAEGRDGRPVYPTLRALWEAVDSSRHTVFVEMLGSKGTSSYLAGRFEVTRVDPEGRAHEGRILLNLRAIDRASTEAGAARADGFIPFAGLARVERYAEVLAHELAHAAWHFADAERARLGARLQGELTELVERRSADRGRGRDEAGPDLAQVEGLALELERGPEAAERAVWKELRSGRRRRAPRAGR